MKEKENAEKMTIPDEVLERLAQVMLPRIQVFFESEEGKLFLERLNHPAEKANFSAQAIAA